MPKTNWTPIKSQLIGIADRFNYNIDALAHAIRALRDTFNMLGFLRKDVSGKMAQELAMAAYFVA